MKMLCAVVSVVLAASATGLDVFWNVPTDECPPNVKFNLAEFGITQNSGDRFKGDKFNILYSPGMFPRVLKSGQGVNGGIPQRGSLEKHLFHLRNDIEDNIAPDYTGPAVIDFEEWQTTLRSSGVLKYRKMSKEYHRLQTKLGAIPHLDNVTAEALFERASRPFLERTLQVARELRPDALWGYYHYPYCKNYQPHVDYCAPAISADNDRSQWIYNNSVALYPSVYLLKHNYTSWDKNVQTRVILEETDRLATKAGGRPVYPYTWFGYHEVVNDYLSPGDLLATIGQVVTRQPAGLIIWGGSSNVNSSRLCRQLRDYVTFRLGPFIRWMLSRTERQLRTL
ncbi:hyaluronidase-like, partial [Pollicipes pollicipes]|uniref:hyaluronidase-like n=1 Tax=Pollicipes pollicipes TaxID=41117 RepID=UPI00188590A9